MSKAKSPDSTLDRSNDPYSAIIANVSSARIATQLAAFAPWWRATSNSEPFLLWLRTCPISESLELEAYKLMKALLKIKMIQENPELHMSNFQRSTKMWADRPRRLQDAIAACETAREKLRACYAEENEDVAQLDQIISTLIALHEQSVGDCDPDRIAAFVGLDPRMIGKRGGAKKSPLNGAAIQQVAAFVPLPTINRYASISSLLALANLNIASATIRSILDSRQRQG